VAPGAFLQSSVSAMLLAGRRDRHEPAWPPPTVFIIDDDADVRVSIAELPSSVGLRAEMFASAPEFLAREREAGLSCLVLDLGLPGMSGLDIQCELRPHGHVDPNRSVSPPVTSGRAARVSSGRSVCGVAHRRAESHVGRYGTSDSRVWSTPFASPKY